MAFMRSEFDGAVFQAMKDVEVAVRDASGLSADGGECVARMELFAGAIGSYKNPHSHRDVDVDDPIKAVEIIMLANHLLRMWMPEHRLHRYRHELNRQPLSCQRLQIARDPSDPMSLRYTKATAVLRDLRPQFVAFA
jgi:uncharacterized protein Ymh